jgi:hypothetical protein
VVEVGYGRVEWVSGRNQAAWAGEGLGNKNPENRAARTRFSLTNGSGDCFCVGGMLLRWVKAGLSG